MIQTLLIFRSAWPAMVRTSSLGETQLDKLLNLHYTQIKVYLAKLGVLIDSKSIILPYSLIYFNMLCYILIYFDMIIYD
jgi:hypothetical protein